ncbi:MAG: transposase family protein [Proteobacteria bacterium]|nr:transposase family protein [Pseudomonadota bacterium]
MRLLDAWRDNPLDATAFASIYKSDNPDVDLSKRQIADVLRRTLPYALYEKPIADKATTTTQYEHVRGGLCMADSAVLKKGFNGAWYVLVVVDAFSGSAFYEAIRRLSARSTAKAFEKILFRFKNATIKRLATDRGSEVSAMYLVTYARTYVC